MERLPKDTHLPDDRSEDGSVPGSRTSSSENQHCPKAKTSGDYAGNSDHKTTHRIDENMQRPADGNSRNIIRRISRYYFPMFRKAGLSPEDAQEAISNVAFKFLSNQHKIKKSEKAFLNKLAKHEVVDFLRKNNAQKRRNISTEYDAEQLEVFGNKYLQDSQEKLMFEDILQTLTPRQQEIIKLLLAGYSQVEIAIEIDIKPSTVFYHIQSLKKNRLIKELFEHKTIRKNREGNGSSQT